MDKQFSAAIPFPFVLSVRFVENLSPPAEEKEGCITLVNTDLEDSRRALKYLEDVVRATPDPSSVKLQAAVILCNTYKTIDPLRMAGILQQVDISAYRELHSGADRLHLALLARLQKETIQNTETAPKPTDPDQN